MANGPRSWVVPTATPMTVATSPVAMTTGGIRTASTTNTGMTMNPMPR